MKGKKTNKHTNKEAKKYISKDKDVCNFRRY